MNNDPNLLRQIKKDYGTEYEKHLFEQYKLYVEMTDRISARRMLANSFFVSVHTALITAFTVLLKEKLLLPTFTGMIPFFAVIVLCFVWWQIIHSYRQLNSGRFKVIHALEQMLPVALFDAEWSILKSGNDRKQYWPLTHIEQWVPICFGALYAFLAIALYFQSC